VGLAGQGGAHRGDLAPIAIVNSTVWAIATTTMYIARQRARVEVERVRAAAHATPQADHELEGERATSTR
jgi:hypothetical protein